MATTTSNSAITEPAPPSARVGSARRPGSNPGATARHEPVELTLLYLDHCPNWSVAADRLRTAVKAVGDPDIRIRWRPVHSFPAAQALGFAGSPTLLVNGVDPFPRPARVSGLCCRFYRTENGDDGAPSVAQLVAVIRETLPQETP